MSASIRLEFRKASNGRSCDLDNRRGLLKVNREISLGLSGGKLAARAGCGESTLMRFLPGVVDSRGDGVVLVDDESVTKAISYHVYVAGASAAAVGNYVP